MMKEICAQCLQPHRDPATGKVTYVFSCFNQDQALDEVDFAALDLRLRQNSVQEKLTAQWIAHALESEPCRSLRSRGTLELDAAPAPRMPRFVSAASGLVRVGTLRYLVVDDLHDLAVFADGTGRAGSLVRLFPGTVPSRQEGPQEGEAGPRVVGAAAARSTDFRMALCWRSDRARARAGVQVRSSRWTGRAACAGGVKRIDLAGLYRAARRRVRRGQHRRRLRRRFASCAAPARERARQPRNCADSREARKRRLASVVPRALAVLESAGRRDRLRPARDRRAFRSASPTARRWPAAASRSPPSPSIPMTPTPTAPAPGPPSGSSTAATSCGRSGGCVLRSRSRASRSSQDGKATTLEVVTDADDPKVPARLAHRVPAEASERPDHGAQSVSAVSCRWRNRSRCSSASRRRRILDAAKELRTMIVEDVDIARARGVDPRRSR